MRIAIQGDTGSFHHVAARHWFGDDIEIVACETFASVFKQLADGSAEHAVVAIENSLYGSINNVYDLLKEHGVPIVGELSERIHQNLVGLPGSSLADIKTVISHPVALDQCTDYLDRQLPSAERREYHDTAAAVRYIVEQKESGVAAIAGTWAAELYGVQVLAERIENELHNYTRFVVVSSSLAVPKDADKCSIVLQTSHQPGALVKALNVFADNEVNLTKLQSRPITGKVWKYQFYIDAEVAGQSLHDITAKLESLDNTVTLLGQYKAGTTEYED